MLVLKQMHCFLSTEYAPSRAPVGLDLAMNPTGSVLFSCANPLFSAEKICIIPR